MLIDTHCHLDEANFPDGPEDVLERALKNGVTKCITVGVGKTCNEIEKAILVARKYENVFATVGIHPHEADHWDETMLPIFSGWMVEQKVVAIGEIGLDFHYMNSSADRQKIVFRRMIQFAKENHMPIVVHTRLAPKETIEILKEENARDVGGVIHCFSEDIDFARSTLDQNFDISFSGIVTFNKSYSIQETAKWIPLDRMVVETDSPYLSPIPFRGKPCEPAYVVHTAKFIAGLRSMYFEDLVQQTTANALKRFHLPLEVDP